MGGPSDQTIGTQQQLTQQQIGIADQQNQLQQQNYARMNELQAPSIAFNQGILSNPALQSSAAAPMISQITQGTNAAKESIANNTPSGAARDYALSQVPIQQNSQIASTLNQTTLSAYDKLANIGSGLGSFSLQELGASLSGLGGASSSNQAAGQMQAQQGSAIFGLLGSLLGAGGTALGGGLTAGGAFNHG